ncbi:hypothetical protein P171DRAFT_485407 [Karstenula rhodostoma CBS 690.94]|uniref:Peptidase M43 pregnancy-associated plasma-A domain-containing protein n=1 Tax=Karstenula rhodostoma CBS 690.94 TaxID=1392251 RepID=A0A9P4PII2_9PLEO|nr:hypothetical protein P171DRAFT_485407 [Karstenula rhodostoma CBS 690.94]
MGMGICAENAFAIVSMIIFDIIPLAQLLAQTNLDLSGAVIPVLVREKAKASMKLISVLARLLGFTLIRQDSFIATNMKLAAAEKARGDAYNSSVHGVQTIQTWFQIISEDSMTFPSNVRYSAIEATMARLNEAFEPVGFAFNLTGVTRVIDKELKNWSDSDSTPLARGHRRGDYTTLNVFVVQDIPTTSEDLIAGVCHLPRHDSTALKEDCCVLTAWSLPKERFQTGPHGGRVGNTVFHEVGHWLGLRHTFTEGAGVNCDNADDMYTSDGVADTPIHLRQPLLGFEHDCGGEQPNTCPKLPGKDPWRNYMNYVSDECKSEFTPGQMARMHSWWAVRQDVARRYAQSEATSAWPASLTWTTVLLQRQRDLDVTQHTLNIASSATPPIPELLGTPPASGGPAFDVAKFQSRYKTVR